MRLAILGAALAATIAGTIPVSAQTVVRDRDDDSVVVREHRDDHDGWRRDHHRGWWRHHAECRVIHVRTRLPNGNVIVKTRQNCD